MYSFFTTSYVYIMESYFLPVQVLWVLKMELNILEIRDVADT